MNLSIDKQVFNACRDFIWHKDSSVKTTHTPTEFRYEISNFDGLVMKCTLYICIPHYVGSGPQNQTGRVLLFDNNGLVFTATTKHNIARAMDKTASTPAVRFLSHRHEPYFFDLVNLANTRFMSGYNTKNLIYDRNPGYIFRELYQKQK